MHVFLFKLVRLLFQLTQCIISKKKRFALDKSDFHGYNLNQRYISLKKIRFISFVKKKQNDENCYNQSQWQVIA